ncbi:tyrosine-type recombinase/integrase [Ferrimicrobium acidiphilum]|uniref:tyrosine-type recombinase/integrase n=1 Tax=Ferrimicrobium acidiphilum TaxID=121039 RepID=UPI0023F3BFFA|nr:site-specific integrase [Ferrimicrobium acidiphilum]
MGQPKTRRARGMGSVKLYGPDNYRAVLRWTDELGRTRTRTRITNTKGEAEQALADFRAERDRNLEQQRPSTLGALLDLWLDVKLPDVSQATQGQYRWAVEKLTDLRNARLDTLRPSTLDSAIADVGMSPRSRQIVRRVLQSACAWGVSQGLMTSDPASGTKAIKQSRRELKAWSAAEIGIFRQACEGERLGPLFLILATLGLRRGEALALRWSDFDREARTLTISKSRSKAWDTVVEGPTKTARSARVIPVPNHLVDVLEAHRARQREEVERLLSLGIRADADYLFTSEYGRPLDPDNASKAFKKFATQAGLGDRHVHELRHLSASLLLARGVPMPIISRILGHSSTAVTDTVYSHLSVEDLRPALDRVWQ